MGHPMVEFGDGWSSRIGIWGILLKMGFNRMGLDGWDDLGFDEDWGFRVLSLGSGDFGCQLG